MERVPPFLEINNAVVPEESSSFLCQPKPLFSESIRFDFDAGSNLVPTGSV